MLTEIPSNSIIRSVGTQRYLTFLIVSWGAVAMCLGFIHTFGQLIALRILLGLFEGGFNVSFIPSCSNLQPAGYSYKFSARLYLPNLIMVQEIRNPSETGHLVRFWIFDLWLPGYHLLRTQQDGRIGRLEGMALDLHHSRSFDHCPRRSSLHLDHRFSRESQMVIE